MDVILHLLGACGDAAIHFDLIDLFVILTTNSMIGIYVKHNWNRIKTIVKKTWVQLHII